jgi:hypothetical protein
MDNIQLLMKIDHGLWAGTLVLSTVAEEENVAKRTVRRAMQKVSKWRGIKTEYDPVTETWRYADKARLFERAAIRDVAGI